LANVSRHDYLPFGEELIPGQGLRSASIGYAANDGVRQKFTQKERDSETGLDYFRARYYSSSQVVHQCGYLAGRMLSPQTLNLYSYVRNNPLKFVDPLGHSDKPQEKKNDLIFLNTPDTPEILVIDSVPANSKHKAKRRAMASARLETSWK